MLGSSDSNLVVYFGEFYPREKNAKKKQLPFPLFDGECFGSGLFAE